MRVVIAHSLCYRCSTHRQRYRPNCQGKKWPINSGPRQMAVHCSLRSPHRSTSLPLSSPSPSPFRESPPMLAAVRRRIFPLQPGALAAALSASTATDPALSYLISSCGFSPAAAARAARSVDLASPRATAQADAVLSLLRRHGFLEADISSAVRQLPALLNVDRAKSLQPKLDFLASVGIEAPLLRQLVLASPSILTRSVENHLEPLFTTLRDVLGSDARVVAALNKKPFVIRCQPESTLFLILPLLRDVHGFSAADVSQLFAVRPGIILLGPDRINEIVEFAGKFGVQPGNPMFCEFCHIKVPTLESKVALYRRLGFHMDDITRMIQRHPSPLTISEKKIADKVGFLTVKAGLTHKDIVIKPGLLGRSLESLSRRCAVLAVLRRSGKQPQHRLRMLLTWTEKRFLEKYVRLHMEEVPDVLRAMNGEIPFQGFDSLVEKSKLPSKMSGRCHS